MDDSRQGRVAALVDDPLWRWVVPAALTMLTAILMFARLHEPARIIFDETYYVNDARDYLVHAVENGFAVHPPVGKWMIAASIRLLGDGPLGWRAAGAVAGSIGVLLTYLIGVRLFRHVGYAALAGLLLATDGLFFVQARTAMLDIHLGLFVVLGAYLLLVDYDRSGLGRRPPAAATEPDADAAGNETPSRATLPIRGHGFRVLAGVSFGLAFATKWSGLLALGAAGLLTLGWELLARRRWTGRWFANLRPMLGSVLVALVLVPIGVYAATYVPWLVNYEHTHEGAKECTGADGEVEDPCDVGLPGRIAGLWRYQVAIARYHEGLEATHAYRAEAHTWPVMARPVVYYWETCSEDRANRVPKTDPTSGEVTVPEPCVVQRGEAAEILDIGNPALWWGFLAGTPLLVAALVRRRRAAAVIAVFYLGQFLPWLVVSRPVFFFYMVPMVPFVALGLAYATSVLAERWPIAAAYAGAAIGGVLGFLAGWWVGGSPEGGGSARWIALGIGWLAGAWIGARFDLNSRHRRPVPRWPESSPGARAGIVVAVLAAVLFVYFFPVWTGLHLPYDAVQQRWWFGGWV